MQRLGLVPYQAAWDLQGQLAAEIAAGRRPSTLLLLEHPHTYTFGRSGRSEHLIWSDEELARRGVSVHWVDRGGDVTYHGPGQLVGYPLIALARAEQMAVEANSDAPRLAQPDYIGYVRKLERVLIEILAEFGVVAGQIPGLTGVWVQADVYSRCASCPPEARGLPAKIAAIGVKVDARGVSRHGFALNVNPDMGYWEGIIGCGLAGYPVTSLAEILSSPPSMAAVMDAAGLAFGRVFDFELHGNAESLTGVSESSPRSN